MNSSSASAAVSGSASSATSSSSSSSQTSHSAPKRMSLFVPPELVPHMPHHGGPVLTCGCSSCKPGAAVSEKMLQCPCLNIAYCSSRCQLSDWPIHGKQCSKAVPDKNIEWLKQFASNQDPSRRKQAMHGIELVKSKNLGCNRSIAIKPVVKVYVNGDNCCNWFVF